MVAVYDDERALTSPSSELYEDQLHVDSTGCSSMLRVTYASTDARHPREHPRLRDSAADDIRVRDLHTRVLDTRYIILYYVFARILFRNSRASRAIKIDRSKVLNLKI